MIITENGVQYKVTGDYPDGDYVKVVFLPPTPRTTISRSEFLDKFTQSELEALYTASDTHTPAGVFLKLLQMHSTLRKTKIDEGLSAFVAKGVITEARKAELLDWGTE